MRLRVVLLLWVSAAVAAAPEDVHENDPDGTQESGGAAPSTAPASGRQKGEALIVLDNEGDAPETGPADAIREVAAPDLSGQEPVLKSIGDSYFKLNSPPKQENKDTEAMSEEERQGESINADVCFV